MNILKDKKKAYFIGIGGIGMSALARYLSNKNIEVYGYDRTSTVLTKKLEEEGMKIHYEDDIRFIPDNIDLVVYTPAIPKDHKEMNWLKDQGHRLYKRSELLKEILKASYVIAVAGTHGKTSTSAVLSHLVKDTSAAATCFVGGIMVNYGTNFLYSDSHRVIVEADEYDRSFLRLFPDVAIIQALDPDHLDIYGTPDEMIRSYREFTMQIKSGGLLVVPNHVLEKMSDHWKADLREHNVQLVSYGEKEDNIFSRAGDGITSLFENDEHEQEVNVKTLESEGLTTDVVVNTDKGDVQLTVPFPGRHNALNSIGAAIVANYLGMDWDEIRMRLASFKGIKRRFEVIHDKDGKVFIDDYAHHPEEIRAMVDALRGCFPGKKILGVFQPHLFTRTRDFVGGFAEQLDKFDEIVLLPIYPAREEPIEGVTSEVIFSKMINTRKSLVEKTGLIDHLKNKEYDVLVTIGAGDIDKLVPEIKNNVLNA